MDKQQLRQSAIKTLKNFSEAEKQNIERKLTENLLSSELWTYAKCIGITMAQGFEWNTKAIIEAAWKQNKTIAVPKCSPKEKKLTFYRLESYDQLEVVYYNLLEPKPVESNVVEKANIDLLVVPGLLFDKKGYRIGFGGGYYDRFLMGYSNETVSILHSSQLVENVPAEPFDIPVQHMITEKEVYMKVK
ncbi:5-formyltetrahydrofolate cyclo-ligase [Virgibacillus profundi]|uniref:5-formyltetrahydrofolate cyclo-ligase n=1 Tax=Virgibacillus profundi TaxID=2024555 RepID=A0A2A2ID49_9BACI|nr:5-formyltetrahydrofolate cyclo-ligase [Virgibacillus profundi]PAV29060.1 5-formyltetrahydrofolate cyclo-ligase [Virgibacillus profundi]PXY53229.1 5-formyltetrahydrofolate cyclo-ligase [Virgibacillus profundi]